MRNSQNVHFVSKCVVSVFTNKKSSRDTFNNRTLCFLFIHLPSFIPTLLASVSGQQILKLSEEEWQEHQNSGKFAELSISYSMEGDLYCIELDAEQYAKYQENCGKLGVKDFSTLKNRVVYNFETDFY